MSLVPARGYAMDDDLLRIIAEHEQSVQKRKDNPEWAKLQDQIAEEEYKAYQAQQFAASEKLDLATDEGFSEFLKLRRNPD